MSIPTPEALLFDLGGVLVEIDFDRAIAFWARYSELPVEGVRSRFKFDAAYEQHERGLIDADRYFAHLAETLKLSASRQDIEWGWNSIFVSEISETRALVQTLRSRVPCHVFSNTNASHKETWTHLYPEVVHAFDSIFASHELGLRKPEPQAFARIAALIGTRPADILFFDDLPENVEAAKDCGFQAVLARSPSDVRDALERAGLLTQHAPRDV